MTTFLLILAAALLLIGAPAMTNLTRGTARRYRGLDQRTRISMQRGAAGAIFAGAAVEEDGNGQAQNLTAAGTTFAGIALQDASALNDSFEIADRVEVLLSIAKGSAIVLTDLGSTVYAGDGNDFNLTSTSRQAIGKITEVPAAAVGSNTADCWVYVEGVQKRSI